MSPPFVVLVVGLLVAGCWLLVRWFVGFAHMESLTFLFCFVLQKRNRKFAP
jgi:hypothetical protein